MPFIAGTVTVIFVLQRKEDNIVYKDICQHVKLGIFRCWRLYFIRRSGADALLHPLKVCSLPTTQPNFNGCPHDLAVTFAPSNLKKMRHSAGKLSYMIMTNLHISAIVDPFILILNIRPYICILIYSVKEDAGVYIANGLQSLSCEL